MVKINCDNKFANDTFSEKNTGLVKGHSHPGPRFHLVCHRKVPIEITDNKCLDKQLFPNLHLRLAHIDAHRWSDANKALQKVLCFLAVSSCEHEDPLSKRDGIDQ